MEKNRIRKKEEGKVKFFLPFYLFTFLLLTSCGDFFELGSNDPVLVKKVELPRKVIPIIVGDSYNIPVTVEPKVASNSSVYWHSENDSVAFFLNNRLLAMKEGEALVHVHSAIGDLADSCVVCVLPKIEFDHTLYPYDMVIFASVNVHGTMLTTENCDSLIIAAYVHNMVRGIGKMKSHNGKHYLEMRVWSPYDYGEEVQLRCYFMGQARMEVFPDVFTFDGERHGNLSSLYPLVLDDKAKEWLPKVEGGGSQPIIVVGDTTKVVIIDNQ